MDQEYGRPRTLQNPDKTPEIPFITQYLAGVPLAPLPASTGIQCRRILARDFGSTQDASRRDDILSR